MSKHKNLIRIDRTQPIYGLMTVYIVVFAYRVVFQSYTDFVSLHISNFAITGMILSLEMFTSVRKGEYSKKRLLNLVITMIVLNVVVELINVQDIELLFGVTFVNFNTADLIDAVFGVVSAACFYAVFRYCSAPKKIGIVSTIDS